MPTLLIELEGQAPSTNKLYFQRGYNRIKTSEYRKWEKYVQSVVSDFPSKLPEGPLSVSIELHDSWFTKAGTIRKKDVFNYEKATTDAVFKALDEEDARIFAGHVYKVDSKQRKTVVKIESFQLLRRA